MNDRETDKLLGEKVFLLFTTGLHKSNKLKLFVTSYTKKIWNRWKKN